MVPNAHDARPLPSTPASRFELAADAIVNGDAATLAWLLREEPELIRARSAREHRATLRRIGGRAQVGVLDRA